MTPDRPALITHAQGAVAGPVWPILLAISLCHMVNDVMQSMLAAIYPLLRAEFSLSYAQIGVMTFAFQVTASLLQPLMPAPAKNVPAARPSPPRRVSRRDKRVCRTSFMLGTLSGDMRG